MVVLDAEDIAIRLSATLFEDIRTAHSKCYIEIDKIKKRPVSSNSVRESLITALINECIDDIDMIIEKGLLRIFSPQIIKKAQKDRKKISRHIFHGITYRITHQNDDGDHIFGVLTHSLLRFTYGLLRGLVFICFNNSEQVS